MPQRKTQGKCALCGNHGELTEEHVPPKCAFNKGRLIQLGAAPWEAGAYVAPGQQVRGRQIQGGQRFATLCGRCNNQLGRDYAWAYGDWAVQIAELRLPTHGQFALPFKIHPLRVLKAILAMFVSVNGAAAPLLCERVRQFLIFPRVGALPPDLRVFVYACSGGYLRTAPAHAIIRSGGGAFIYSEVACMPLGCVLSLDGRQPDPRLLEITDFRLERLESERTVFLQMPHFRLDSPIPLDFRSWAELERAKDENERKHPGSTLGW